MYKKILSIILSGVCIHHYSTFSGPGLSIGISQSGSVSLGFSFTPINKGAAMWDKTYTRTSYL